MWRIGQTYKLSAGACLTHTSKSLYLTRRVNLMPSCRCTARSRARSPFGPIASVTAFLRMSLAIWAIGNSLLNLTWSAYFDGFLSFSEGANCKRIDMCISALFAFPGWKLSEDKLAPFSSICKVLGVQLDLRSASLGLVLVSNTQERIEEITSEIAEVLQQGRLSKIRRTGRS